MSTMSQLGYDILTGDKLSQPLPNFEGHIKFKRDSESATVQINLAGKSDVSPVVKKP
jgi:hypothetical protein